MSTSWFGTTQKPSPRAAIEIAAMKKLFDTTTPTVVRHKVSWDSDFLLYTLKLELNPAEPIHWTVQFSMYDIEETGKGVNNNDTFTIRILYPSNFPAGEPQVEVTSHNVNGVHVFNGGKLCLHSHRGASSGWDPAASTAATFGLWSVQWIRAWIYYKTHTIWPDANK